MSAPVCVEPDLDVQAWIPGGAAAHTQSVTGAGPRLVVHDADAIDTAGLWARTAAPLAAALTLELVYDPTLSRVRITATGLDAAATAIVERSTTQVSWTTVRGGAGVTVTAGAVGLDDYEFTPDVPNFYRVRMLAPFAAAVTGQLTPTLDSVWLKSIGRPFLNRPVTVLDFSPVERSARAGVFTIVGRPLPVAVSDLRGPRRWSLDILADTLDAAATLDLLLASGDTLLVHIPAGCPVPGGYVTVGDTTERRTARYSARRILTLPCTQVAAPAADVVGATYLYQSVANDYATYADLAAANPTYADLAENIGHVQDVIVA